LSLKKLSEDKKIVILDFWGLWCGPCVTTIPELEKVYSEYKDKGVVVIGMHTSIDNSKITFEQIEKFTKEKGLTFPIAVDRGNMEYSGETFQAYGSRAVPAQWLIDKTGKVRANVSLEELLKEE
jgi:thiol-disulfide isomerase/thioredoxin